MPRGTASQPEGPASFVSVIISSCASRTTTSFFLFLGEESPVTCLSPDSRYQILESGCRPVWASFGV